MHQKQRSKQKEQLDNLDLSGEKLHRTLDELALINRFLGNYRAICKAVFEVILRTPQPDFHLIDIGCGGGDVLIHLAKQFRKKGIKATFLGIDGNEHSLAYARAKAVDFPEINFQQGDLLSKNFELPSCDILLTTHFLYHFDNQAVILFLQSQSKNIHLAFLASELERNTLAVWCFRLFSPFLSLSKLTKADGVLAIQRAFTKEEVEILLKDSHFQNFRVRKRAIFRLMIECKFKPSNFLMQ